MRELIDTERIYVSEVSDILTVSNWLLVKNQIINLLFSSIVYDPS